MVAITTAKPRVGIEKITAYPCTLSVDMHRLAVARDHDPNHPLNELWVTERSLNPVWEDPVTMAVNAARSLLSPEDLDQIGLIVVGTESSPDFGKPMSTYIQRHCGITQNCRNFETKHACYGGTGGLMMAAHWIASGYNRGRKALIVTSDQSRTHLGKPWEYVLGAGAVAMLVSDTPDVLAFELESNGFYTNEIFDTYRPTSTKEVGHADTSLYGYLDALEGAYEDFLAQVGDINYDEYFKKHIYHVPFGGMTFRAHKAIMRRYGRMKARESRLHFERKSKPALTYNSRFGGTYTSATFIAMLGLIDNCDDLQPDDRISVFSYGSGSCAEFYSTRLGPRAREVVAAAQVKQKLDARQDTSIEDYEIIERTRSELIDKPSYELNFDGFDDLYKRAYEGKKRLVLESVTEFQRNYRLS